MGHEQVLERFREMLASDSRDGHVRPLHYYQRLLHGHSELIAREYELLVDREPTPPLAVESPSSSDSILEQLPRGDEGLRPEGEIARGGMGAIEKVREDALHRDLAMKVMLPEREADAMYVHRFLEEAQVTAQLDHPGVVPVHRLGKDARGRLFFTMKLVKGRTLSRIFRFVQVKEDNWSTTRVLGLFIRICETLAFAHQKGVIHRDLKPANIMVGSFGELYVMDWGLAKVLGDSAEPVSERTPAPIGESLVKSVRSGDSSSGDGSPTQTIVGDVLGTPSYMPLEQALGSGLDARSDVYAVGAMMYELLAGHAPFGDKQRTSAEVIVANVAGAPTPLRTLRPDVPGELIAICEKAMARDPASRYQSAAELAQEIRDFLEGRVVRAYRTGAVVELRKWISRNRALAGAIGAAFVLLVAGLVVSGSLYKTAVQESDRSQRLAYRAAIAAAASEIHDHDLETARRRLDAQPKHLRGWEWRHLRSRIDGSFASLPLRGGGFDARNGHVLGIVEGGALVSCDPRTGAMTTLLPQGASPVRAVEFQWISADGRYCLVGLANGRKAVRDLHESKTLLRYEGPMANKRGFNCVRPWFHGLGVVANMETGETLPLPAAARLANQRALQYQQSTGMVSPSQRQYVVLQGDTVRLFDAATDTQVGGSVKLRGAVAKVVWNRTGSRMAISGVGRAVKVVDTATGSVERTLYGHSGNVFDLAFSVDGRFLLSASKDGSRVWDVSGEPDSEVLRGHNSYVYGARFSPDGRRIVTTGWDGYLDKPGSIRVWDRATGRQIVRTRAHAVSLDAAYLPGGDRLITSTRGKTGLVVRDADTFEVVRVLAGTHAAIALDPSGTRVVAANATAGVFDVASGKRLASMAMSGAGIAWSSRWIGAPTAVAGDHFKRDLTLWNSRTYEREAVIQHTGKISGIAFEPNGDRVVIAGAEGGAARVYDCITQELLATLPGHGLEALSVCFTPDAQRILVGGREGNIHVWDAASYHEIVQLRAHTNYVYKLSFSPDGETLLSCSGDGTARLWETVPAAVRQRAIAERALLVAELKPLVLRLFGELKQPKAVAARLRSELTGRRREVALQLALAEAVARSGE